MRGRQMERDDFEAVAEFMFRSVQEALGRKLTVYPMIFGIALDDHHKVAGYGPVPGIEKFFTEQWGEHGRDLASAELVKVAGDPRVDIAALVFRGWVIPDSVKLPTPAQAAQLELHPDAEDGFIAILRTLDYTQVMLMPYKEETNALTRLPLRWDGQGWTGRFAHRSKHQTLN